MPASADNESLIRSSLERYLTWGGFPEIVLAEEALRPLILTEYASLMLYHDIVERYGVRNETLMRELMRHCFRNTASLLSVSRLHGDFKSLGLSVSKNTLFEYLSFLEDSFLVFLLPKQERSLRKQAHNPKKLHVIDPGLIAAFQPHPPRDPGHNLETAVFLEARRRRKDLHYFRNSAEVDLCSSDGAFFVNSCWSLTDPATLRRENEALSFASNRWPAGRGLLLYHEYQTDVEQRIPAAQAAWKFLIHPDEAIPELRPRF